MQRISVSNLCSGMIIARHVYSSDSRLLLKAGTLITEKFVHRLKNMGLGSVYVFNPFFQDLEIPEIVNQDTRLKSLKTLQVTFDKFTKSQIIDIEPIKALARSLVEDIVRNRDTMLHILDTGTYDDYLHNHSLNVCLLSVLTATFMEYNEDKLRDLAVGALLHDLGMTMVPKDIATKPEPRTSKEENVIHQHTLQGFEAMRKVRDISILSAHVAFQHHEQLDGHGYPRGLKEEEIHEFAKICSIADLFDTMIADRPNQKGMLPHEAYEFLMTLSGSQVDGEILQIFLANIAIYPIGTVVQLDNGDIGIVTDVQPKLQARPLIYTIANKNGEVYKNPKEVNLSEHLTTVITRVLPENEVFGLAANL